MHLAQPCISVRTTCCRGQYNGILERVEVLLTLACETDKLDRPSGVRAASFRAFHASFFGKTLLGVTIIPVVQVKD